MTYNELLHSVTFDEIAPFVEKKAGRAVCLALYKTHYDMLRLLTPRRKENDNETATVTNAKLYHEWEEPKLDAYPLEGDLWEVSLAKELVIAPDVTASLGEIAACCLWHTSFYGFTPEQERETFEKLQYYSENLVDVDIERIKASRIKRRMEAAGGRVPTKNEMLQLPSFRRELKRYFPEKFSKKKRRGIARRAICRIYNERIVNVGTFVTSCLPALQSDKEMSANDLCRLFLSDHFAHYSYQTYAGSAADRGRWMMELIEKYDAFCGSNGGIRPNVMMLVTVSPEHPFSDSDRQLTDMIARMCSGRTTLLLKHDDSLGEELQLNVAFYGELKNRRRHRPLPCSGRGAQYFCPKKTRI